MGYSCLPPRCLYSLAVIDNFGMQAETWKRDTIPQDHMQNLSSK